MEEISIEIMRINESFKSLEGKYEQTFQQTLHNEQMFWMIILGVFGIIALALYFLSKSFVQSGVEKGIGISLEGSKDKLDRKSPEILGPLSLSNSDKDTSNVRLVKLLDEPTINIETDKNNSSLMINHRKVLTDDSFIFTSTLVNGWTGKATVFVADHKTYKLIELKFLDLRGGVISKGTMISMLPVGFRPSEELRFKGYWDNGADILFTINRKGDVVINNTNGSGNNINANIVFIVHNYEEK